MITRATRFAPLFLATATLMFVAGVATSSSLMMMLSLAASAGLIVSLGLEDRRVSREARDASPVTSGATPTVESIDTAVAAGVAAATEARGDVATLIDLDNNTVTQTTGDLEVEIDLDKAMDVEDLLATIQGVGPAKVSALAAAFPTPVQLRAATRDELTAVKGVGPALADRIIATVR